MANSAPCETTFAALLGEGVRPRRDALRALPQRLRAQPIDAATPDHAAAIVEQPPERPDPLLGAVAEVLAHTRPLQGGHDGAAAEEGL